MSQQFTVGLDDDIIAGLEIIAQKSGNSNATVLVNALLRRELVSRGYIAPPQKTSQGKLGSEQVTYVEPEMDLAAAMERSASVQSNNHQTFQSQLGPSEDDAPGMGITRGQGQAIQNRGQSDPFASGERQAASPSQETTTIQGRLQNPFNQTTPDSGTSGFTRTGTLLDITRT